MFSHPIMSDSLRPRGLQHVRPPHPSPSPRVCPSSCSLHRWCHPAISSSDALFSFCPNLSQHQGLFQQVICSHQMTKILELQLQHQYFQWIFRGLSPLRLTGLILLSNRLSRVFSSTIVWRHQFFGIMPSLWSGSHNRTMTTGKTIALTYKRTFVGRVMPLLFNTQSRFVIAFLPRSNCLLISWLQSPSAVILEPKKRKLVTLPPFPLLFAMQQWGRMPRS